MWGWIGGLITLNSLCLSLPVCAWGSVPAQSKLGTGTGSLSGRRARGGVTRTASFKTIDVFAEEELRKLREETNAEALRQELERERQRRVELEQRVQEALKARWVRARERSRAAGRGG